MRHDDYVTFKVVRTNGHDLGSIEFRSLGVYHCLSRNLHYGLRIVKTKMLRTRYLDAGQVHDMFDVMREYYEGMRFEVFEKDLSSSDTVILLLSSNGSIQGFSIQNKYEMTVNGERRIALFSGDTVLRRKYWGNGALATAFGRFLFKMKLRYPLTGVYWFLSSSGYRGYLLMANNFPEYYPRFDQPTPADVSAMMERFYGQKFGSDYRSDLGLTMAYEADPCRVKETVAPIGQLELTNPKIAFFAAQNPEWSKGVELACVARVSLSVPIMYAWKRFKKTTAALGYQWLIRLRLKAE